MSELFVKIDNVEKGPFSKKELFLIFGDLRFPTAAKEKAPIH